jgi:hypothetical protein
MGAKSKMLLEFLGCASQHEIELQSPQSGTIAGVGAVGAFTEEKMQADFEHAAADAAELFVTQRLLAKEANAAYKRAASSDAAAADAQPQTSRLVSAAMDNSRSHLLSCKPADPSAE